MGDVLPDDFDPEIFDEEALDELDSLLSEANIGQDQQPSWDVDPDGLVTEDKLEDQIGDIGGVTEDEAAEIAQQYSLGGLHHIIEGDCDHPEHQKIREKLGIEESQDQDSDGDGDDSTEGAEDEEPEGDSSSGSEESDSGQSEANSGNGGAWGTNG